jgi:hypothetical protein
MLVTWSLIILASLLTVAITMVSVTTCPADSEFLAGQFVTVAAQLVIVLVMKWEMVKVVWTPESVDDALRPRRWWKCWGACW